MSLFFSELKSPNIKDNQIAKEHGCSICPLAKLENNTPKMPPGGTDKPILYFIGEAPGKQEDLDGKQFVGAAGQTLRKEVYNILRLGMESLGKDFNLQSPKAPAYSGGGIHNPLEESKADYMIRWNNIVRCRPYDKKANRTPEPIEIECCKHSVFADIEKTKPLIVVGFGGIPLKVFTGGNKIGLWRGRMLPIKVGNHICWYYSTYHPSFINRVKDVKNNRENQYDRCFRMDLQNLFLFVSNYKGPEYIADGYDRGIVPILGVGIQDFGVIKQYLNNLSELPEIAIDIETVGKKAQLSDFKMISVAIGTDKEVIAFPLDHPRAWNFDNRDDNIRKIYGILNDFIINSGAKIAHNLKFELNAFLKAFGQKTIRSTAWHDTMVQAYLLDERTSKEEGMLSLDRLIHLNFGFNLKGLTPVDRKNPLKAKLEDLLIYNGMDSKYEYKLFVKQREQVIKEGFEQIYNSLIGTTITLSVTESCGVLVDLKQVREFSDKLEGKLKALDEEIKTLPEVKQFGVERFNPLSPQDLIVIFRDICGITDLKLTAKETSYSTNDKVLKEISERGIKLAYYILQYRSVNKLKSTYIDNVKAATGKDGMLYPNFNHLYTSTGRFSSGRE